MRWAWFSEAMTLWKENPCWLNPQEPNGVGVGNGSRWREGWKDEGARGSPGVRHATPFANDPKLAPVHLAQCSNDNDNNNSLESDAPILATLSPFPPSLCPKLGGKRPRGPHIRPGDPRSAKRILLILPLIFFSLFFPWRKKGPFCLLKAGLPEAAGGQMTHSRPPLRCRGNHSCGSGGAPLTVSRPPRSLLFLEGGSGGGGVCTNLGQDSALAPAFLTGGGSNCPPKIRSAHLIPRVLDSRA